MTKSKCLGLFLVALFAGCYSKDFNEPGIRDLKHFPTERNFNFSYNSTWNALLGVLKDAPILSAKKESGQLQTDWIYAKSEQLYSGYDDTRIPMKIRYRMTVTLQPLNAGTTVKIKNQEQYYTDAITTGGDINGSIYQWVDTKTSTQKEKNLLDSLEAYLSKAPAPPSN